MRDSSLNDVKGYNTILTSAKGHIEQINFISVINVCIVCILNCLSHKAIKNTAIARYHFRNVYRNKAFNTSCIFIWYQFRSLKNGTSF